MSLEQLYHVVDSLVHVTRSGEELYEKLKMEGERAAVEVGRQLKNQVGSPNWLQHLAQLWSRWVAQVVSTR